MFKLGVTGGIGSGKSSVCEFFAEQGIEIIEADDVAREVVLPGSSCLAAIEEKFGAEILLADGSLDRAKMRTVVRFGSGCTRTHSIGTLIDTRRRE